MTETEAKLILGAIDGLRTDNNDRMADVISRMDDFSETSNTRFTNLQSAMLSTKTELVEAIVDKCETCANGASFKAKLDAHWWHIVALWSAIAFVGIMAFSCSWYIFSQLNEHRMQAEKPAIIQPKEVKP